MISSHSSASRKSGISKRNEELKKNVEGIEVIAIV